MPNITPPNNYNSEDLFLFCELSSFPNIGGKSVDFTGLKTYNVGFIKQGVGFGITNINVEISPSMQPIIEITFKDLYGNAAIEFDRNAVFLSSLADKGNINDLNYRSMFDLPYPKFKLTLKGYIGKPSAMELNVKRIDVSYVPTDGSYEIKAVFVPNLYGFFADLPFYFLKAIKGLRGITTPGNSSYLSIIDVVEAQVIVQQEQQVIGNSISDIKEKLNRLHNLSDSIFDDDFDWISQPEIRNTDSKGNPIGKMPKIFINVSKYLSRKDKTNSGLVNKSVLLTAQKNSTRDKNIYSKVVVGSISTSQKTNDSEVIYFFDDAAKAANSTAINNGKTLIKQALAECEKYEQEQLVITKKDYIAKTTIKTVFDLLIRDSAFLMGKIIEAGLKGYNSDKNRKDNTDLIGLYYPLTYNSDNEQISYNKAIPEINFVNSFIKALSGGIAEYQRKGLDQSSSLPEGTTTELKKRISNLEIGKQNPYAISPTKNDIIRNLLERTGLISHLFLDDIVRDLDGDTVKDAITSELENVNEGIEKISKEDEHEILAFCEMIKNEISEDGSLKDVNFLQNKSNKITSYLNETSSRIDFKSLTSKVLLTNNIYYSHFPNHSRLYVLFKNSAFENNSTATQSTTTSPSVNIGPFSVDIGDGNDTTAPYSVSNFKIQKIDNDNKDEVNKLIENLTMIDFEKMQKQLKISDSKNIDLLTSLTGMVFTQNLTASSDLSGKYLYGRYSVDFKSEQNSYVWNFAGTTYEAKLQRYILLNICKEISKLIVDNEIKFQEESRKITEKLSDQRVFEIIYTQFHHLCNNWKNLIDAEITNDIGKYLEDKFVNEFGAINVFYEIPLQNIKQSAGGFNLKVENAIVNVDALRNSNEQSTVLNIMSNLCVKNNFMFLAIPGLGDSPNSSISNENIEDLFKPYIEDIQPNSIIPSNHFYVLWMPTPENRIKHNNGDPLYIKFEPDNLNLKKDIFEINYGSLDNTIFKSITMSTEDNKVTSESAIAINNIADPNNSKNFKNFDCSALSVMEGRSYKISVEMIGNSQIKPTQFFVLNSTHIFRGLYQIMKVSHTINNNIMTTKFEAIKMKYSGKNSEFIFIPPITLDGIKEIQQLPQPQPKDTTVIDVLSTGEQFGSRDLNNSIRTSQEKKIQTLHEDVRGRFRNFIYEIQNTTNYIVDITSAYRTFEQQRIERINTNGKASLPGYSYHNYGLAIDINLQGENKNIKLKSPQSEWLDTGVIDIAKKYGFRWGGNFKGYKDNVHFDVGNDYNTTELLQKAYKQFGTNTALIKGNELDLS